MSQKPRGYLCSYRSGASGLAMDREGESSARQHEPFGEEEVSQDHPVTGVFAEGTDRESECGGAGWK